FVLDYVQCVRCKVFKIDHRSKASAQLGPFICENCWEAIRQLRNPAHDLSNKMKAAVSRD
ncbi:hypothetical protein NPIL_158531, partial [Nephila pilipes]